ncbi:tetratricopeptide repeat protein [candidate division KSB1 bacterium]|nr:tetratricopeptide repeat protein [candidate division KSB1 bacterium]
MKADGKRLRRFLLILLLLFGIVAGYSQDLEKQKSLVTQLLAEKKNEAAIDTLKAMRLQRQEDPELYYLLGKAYHDIGDYKNAEVAYKMALYFKSTYVEANYELGLTKLKQNLPAEAIYFLDQVIQIQPDYDEARRRLGEAYYLVEKYQPALDALNWLIKKNDRDYESYYFVGLVRWKQNLHDAAVWNFQQCLGVKLDYLPALKALSQLYTNFDRGVDALPIYEKIIEISPDSLKDKETVRELFFQRGKMRFQKDSLMTALNDFRKVLILDPVHKEARTILDEVYKKRNYDSLMTQATQALENQNLLAAQSLFSKAVLQAKNNSEQDSANNYLDSLNSMLNMQKFESKISTLFNQAEEAFNNGEYELALKYYQEILILNPSDEASQSALKETGSIKYFLEATNEWKDENWKAALENFEKVISFYPNFPGINAKYQALKKIERIETQRAIVHRALRNGHYQTAKSLFEQLFKFDSQNPKLFETWFLIKKHLLDFYIEMGIRFLPHLGIGLFVLLILFAFLVPRRPARFFSRLKLSFGMIFLIIPAIAVALIGIYLMKAPLPADAEIELNSEHISLLLEENQELNASLEADSISISKLSQLELTRVNFNQNMGAGADTSNYLKILGDTLKNPLEVQFNQIKEPVVFDKNYLESWSKLNLRLKNSNVQMTFFPPLLVESSPSWLVGTVNVPGKILVKIPKYGKILNDTTGKSIKVNSRELVGMPLDETSSVKFQTSITNMQILLKRARSITFQNLPVTDVSYLRFVPGDGEVKVRSGLKKAKITLSSNHFTKKEIETTRNFYFYPNYLTLKAIQIEKDTFKLMLVGKLRSIIIRNDNGQFEEMMPSYFSLINGKWPWALPVGALVWLVLTIIGIIFLLRYNRRQEKRVIVTEMPPQETPKVEEKVITVSFKELILPFHTHWQEHLSQTLIPELEKRKVQLEGDVQNEKNRQRKREITKLLNDTKLMLDDYVNELNNKVTEG